MILNLLDVLLKLQDPVVCLLILIIDLLVYLSYQLLHLVVRLVYHILKMYWLRFCTLSYKLVDEGGQKPLRLDFLWKVVQHFLGLGEVFHGRRHASQKLIFSLM